MRLPRICPKAARRSPGVISCGEIGGRGVADQEVKGLLFKSG
jgi:hypothetical protein